MKTFEVKGSHVGEFIKKIEGAMQGRSLGQIVSFENRSSEISIIFSKLGRSELKFTILPIASENGFLAKFKDEKIALTHRIARRDIERKLVKVISDLGAKID